MIRVRPHSALLVLLVGVLLWTATPVAAEELREVTEKARAYFDLDIDFTWRPRKAFGEELDRLADRKGTHPLRDVDLLSRIVMQGRLFLDPFDDPRWHRERSASWTIRGDIRSIVSEEWQFAYAVPKQAKKRSRLDANPRPGPWPLLVSIHGKEEVRAEDGSAYANQGGAALASRWGGRHFQRMDREWYRLAPSAKQGFLHDDGSIRHVFLTTVLTEFWRRYHVDFDRIVIDGGAAAAALAATFPHVFAGLVLREGPIDPSVVRNYAAVPVYVLENPSLGYQLKSAGHPNVRLGTREQLMPWLATRKREVPNSFTWRAKLDDHRYPNWIGLREVGPECRMSVRKDDAGNRIDIDLVDAATIDVFLSDRVVDLDREVTITVNAAEVFRGVAVPTLKQAFALDPYVRRNMNFGWLYPVRIEGIQVSERGTTLSQILPGFENEGRIADTPEALPAPPDDGDADGEQPALPGRTLTRISERRRLDVQRQFLYGRLDRIDTLLEPAEHADDLYPLALRDLWWRSTRDPETVERWRIVAQGATPAVAAQYAWLLNAFDGGAAGGGDGSATRRPYPKTRAPHQDPWPVLTALVLDRLYREKIGRAHLPEASPLATMTPPDAWAKWWPEWREWFLESYVRVGIHGLDPAKASLEDRAAEQAKADRAAEVRTRSLVLALITGLLFVGGVLLAGRRLARRPGEPGRSR